MNTYKILRTALVAVLTMLSASMYAENEPVKYIDSDGQEKYVVDYTVLTGDEDTLTSGWYVVNQPALISLSGLMIKGDVRIILCDECVWSINEVVNGNPCPFGAYMGSCLRFYAQSTGEYAGKLHEDEKALHAYNCCPYFFNGDSLEINGGIIEFIGWDDNSPVIVAQNVTINGGRLNLSKIECGISCHNLHLNGGELNISASDMAFIAKVEASRNTGATVYLKRQNQILWGSDAPDRGSDCIPTLKSARIGEVYDNAVELDVCVFKGQRAENTGIHYTVTAYCFYDKEECIKPVIGMIAIDAAEDGHAVEKTLMLTDKEREALQQVLDKVEFRQYQFGNEVVTIEEEEEREI